MTPEDRAKLCFSPPHAASPHQLRSISPGPSSTTAVPAPPLAHFTHQSTPAAGTSHLADEPARTTRLQQARWTPRPGIGRYDSAPLLAREVPGFCLLRPGTGTRAWPALKPAAPDASTGPPAPGPLGKRQEATDKSVVRPLESPTKKPRLVGPGDLSLPPLDDLTSAQSPVTSPLFFSSSPRHMLNRPPRPPSFSTSEAAPSIMGDGQYPDGVTTLRLPKGKVSATSPARSSGTPRSWSSTDLSSLSRSPDGWPQPSAVQLLQGIGVVELLEQDERPTFIVDLNDSANLAPGPLHLVYANVALRTAPALLGLLQSSPPDSARRTELAGFKAWAVSLVGDKTSPGANPSSATYAGLSWTSSTLRRRFRIIRGYPNTNFSLPASPSQVPSLQPSPTSDPGSSGPWSRQGPVSPSQRSDYFGSAGGQNHVRSHSEPRSRAESAADTVVRPFDDLVLASPPLRTTFDWTRIPVDDHELPAHHRFARSIDWASTPLGPVELWPLELRIMSSMIMGSPHPAALYWGPEYVAIYNEAYISLAGQKHPQLMGSRYRDAWPEIWDEIQPVFDAAWNSGDATMKHDDALFISRHNFMEETFFNWAIIPLVGGDGTVVALYNPAFENTRRRIVERQMLTLREIGIKTAQARDVKSFWTQLHRGLEYNELDAPFALIYSVGEDSESDASSLNSGSLAHPPQIVLEGSIGVPDGHPCAVASIDLRFSDEGFAPYMRESMAHSATPIVLSVEDGTLPPALIEGVSWAGFGDPCRTIVVFPVHPTTAGDAVVGFIVLGINPRRPYDAEYQLFVSLLSRQLATSLASVVLFEEEIRRGQKAARLAALDRQELSLQLHLRTQEAVESEYRFTRMAEFGPVGLFIADGHGHINYCNEMWYRISGLPRDASTFAAWMQSIRDEDRPGTELAWRRLVEEKVAVTHEFRFHGSRELMDGHMVDVWALMSAYPERDETGGLKSIFGCITDISQQKWAESFQKQRRDEAVELKRQQENFIDITSHEMRNPLSAILQCADEIASGLSQYNREEPSAHGPVALDALVGSCVEAASIISLCANHQKRIVDDILTLSKLDSKLLLVTPVDVQPVAVVQDVLKMFESELTSHGIGGRLTIEQSYRDLAVDWVKLDPSRLRQVLINLMTNAIKSTQGRPARSIVIRIGASTDVVEEDGLSYVPPRQPDQEDFTDKVDWADGEKINLRFAVTDTGSGLDDDEKRILFQRFSEASPRTHVQYGGSGLGLFICRTLTELQGGQIAVQSKKGEGSTFGFYIKGRKLNPSPANSPFPTPAPMDNLPYPSPLLTSPLEQMPFLARPSTPTNEPLPTPPPPAMREADASRLDILIVEDNLVNQKVLKRQLELSGSNTYVANHGGEALAELRRSRFWGDEGAAAAEDNNNRNISVILMDLEMPVMDGISCTREIRRLEAEGVITQHIPIIAVTAYARPEQVENAKAAGVDGVISKPFRISELIPKIEELVTKFNMVPKPSQPPC
ncbi:hypothetical protein C8A00DRAFT_31608 [Chaetomidium leptoderma]|uniref:Uncharacterized protein n=1 Tax=Chaetomidium leptoderma TaxID=669021 RepID=A0AAN6VQQ6_9PEZI|nr:hypothetical protein C8A00DRAFT_31608 [Chaetomidium leptoderma]